MSYQPPQQPYPQAWPPQQPYVPPPGPPKRRHAVRTVLLITGGVFLAVIIAAAVAGGGQQPAGPPAAATGTTSAAAARTTAAAAAGPAITYVVTGTPGGADVTYGPEGSSLSGNVPMRATKKLGHAGYYSISAQLNGGGRVTVKILVGGKVISRGTATGGYNIASAEISQDPFTGRWENVQ